jgi:hypothetical protein
MQTYLLFLFVSFVVKMIALTHKTHVTNRLAVLFIRKHTNNNVVKILAREQLPRSKVADVEKKRRRENDDPVCVTQPAPAPVPTPTTPVDDCTTDDDCLL